MADPVEIQLLAEPELQQSHHRAAVAAQVIKTEWQQMESLADPAAVETVDSVLQPAEPLPLPVKVTLAEQVTRAER